MLKSNKRKKPRKPIVNMKKGQIALNMQTLMNRFNYMIQDYTILKLNYEANQWIQRKALWYRWIPVIGTLIDIWWTSDRMVVWAGNRIVNRQLEERDKAEAEQKAKIEAELQKNLEAEKADKAKNEELKKGYVDRAEEDLALVNEEQNRLIKNGEEMDSTPPKGTKVKVEEPDVNAHKLNPELSDEEIEEEVIEDSELDAVASV